MATASVKRGWEMQSFGRWSCTPAKYTAPWKKRGNWIWDAISRLCYSVYRKGWVHMYTMPKELFRPLLWVAIAIADTWSGHVRLSDQWLFSDSQAENYSQIIIKICVIYITSKELLRANRSIFSQKKHDSLKRTLKKIFLTLGLVFFFFTWMLYPERNFLSLPPSFSLSFHLFLLGFIFNK